MRRRDFVVIVAGAVAGRPAILRAQDGRRRPVVAIVSGPAPLSDIVGPDPALREVRTLLHRLRDLGWVEGRTVTIERWAADGHASRAPAILAEVVARGADVIVVGATDWLIDAARKATRRIPIVAIFSADPVAAGLVAGLARPGTNLTGISSTPNRSLVEKRLELLKELAPQAGRVAFLGKRAEWETYRGAADVASVPPILSVVEHPQQFDEAFALVLRERAGALLVSHGPVLFLGVPRIVAFAAEKRLPSMFPWREAAEAGGLAAYGATVQESFRQLADFVDRILRGAKAAELPIEQPARTELSVNLKTAKALRLAVSPALLARADLVIE